MLLNGSGIRAALWGRRHGRNGFFGNVGAVTDDVGASAGSITESGFARGSRTRKGTWATASHSRRAIRVLPTMCTRGRRFRRA